MEAAVWCKPVIYGPLMGDFLEAKALLERIGVGFMVKDRDELVKKPNGYWKIQMIWIAWERGPGMRSKAI